VELLSQGKKGVAVNCDTTIAVVVLSLCVCGVAAAVAIAVAVSAMCVGAIVCTV